VKATKLDCILLSAPYATPGDAEREIHLRTGYRCASFIRVETDKGLVGLGETYAGVYAPETVRALVGQFSHDLVGEEIDDPGVLHRRLSLSSYYWGRMGITQSVLGGIEMALWDLVGKARGVPVVELLGGTRHAAIRAYASGGNDKPLDELRLELEGYVRAGYLAVKIRINNLTVEQIVDKVAFARRVLGPDIGLAVDAVQGTAANPWAPARAIELARRLEPYDLLWIEEPAEVADYRAFAEVRSNTQIPIAGGETVTSLTEVRNYLDAGALDLFQPDASLIGGLGIFRQAADLCAHRGIPVAVHAWSGGVGIMGNYHAAFATPNCEWLELPTVPNPLRDEVLLEPLRLVDGKITSPTQPGLGVDLPEGLEERHPFRPDAVYRILGKR
jgi:L-alanine-DL-glutamate epimerase-like enolase superfamily enzyme